MKKYYVIGLVINGTPILDLKKVRYEITIDRDIDAISSPKIHLKWMTKNKDSWKKISGESFDLVGTNIIITSGKDIYTVILSE